MTFRSYAQNFEDVILWRALKHVSNGCYIDIGANDPVHDSVSLAFYERGWRGVHVEPMAEFAAKLRAARPDETVVEAAVASSGKPITLYVFEGTGLTTSSVKFAEQHQTAGRTYRKMEVPSRTLASIFAETNRTEIHWLKIDVEGMEGEVLRSWERHKAQPWIIVIESTLPNSTEEYLDGVHAEMTERGYEFAYFDGLNRFYVHNDHPELLKQFGPGPNYFDNFTLTEHSVFTVPLLEKLNASEVLRCHLETVIAETNKTHEQTRQQLKRARQELDQTRQATDQIRQDAERSLALQQQDRAVIAALKTAKFALEKRQHGDWQTIAELRAAKTALETEVIRLEEEKAEICKQFADTKAGLETKLRSAGAALAETKNATAQEISTLRARTTQHEATIEAIYKSTSWRLMAPVRGVKIASRKTFNFGMKGLRSGLERALCFVRKHPTLKAPLLSVASVSPQLKRKLVHFGRVRPEVGAYARPLPVRPLSSEFAPPRVRTFPSSESRRHARSGKQTFYVYVDFTVVCPVNTGMQRVVRGLTSGLVNIGAELLLVKWSREKRAFFLINQDELAHLSKWNGADVSRQMARYPKAGEEVQVSEHEAIDECWLIIPEVTHINAVGDNPTLDIILAARQLNLKTAAIFFDAIPLKRTEFSDMAGRHEEYMRHLLLADLIVPISKWAGKDLMSYFCNHECADPTSIPRIDPILLPTSSIHCRIDRTASSTNEKLILAVGTIDQRKNQGALLTAFEQFSRSNPGWRIALVGNLHPTMAKELATAAASNTRIEYVGTASDETLRELYRNCAFTVFPSVEEGFGLPIVESLSYGKPCICANFGAMFEVAQGGGCVTIDVREPTAIAAAMEALAHDIPRRTALSQAALSRPQTTWNDYAQAFLGSIAKLRPANTIGCVYYWVDQTCAYSANTGIQRVVRSLAKAMMDNGRRLVPVKWDTAREDFAPLTSAELDHLAKWNGPPPSTWHEYDDFSRRDPSDWLCIPEVLSAPSGPKIEKVHSKARERGLRVLWIFHDAIPSKMPDIYPPQATAAHRSYMSKLVDADLVLAVSDCARNDLIDYVINLERPTPNLFERVSSCPLPGEFPGALRASAIKASRSDVARILSVGTVEPRKNYLRLLDGFGLMHARLPDGKAVELTIVGGCPFPELQQMMDDRIRQLPGVRWLKSIGDLELQRLYDECDFTVYPSVEEGFGLPILESLWHGRPCICRNAGSMAELAVDGGCLAVETYSPEALADGMTRLTLDVELRSKLASEALKRPFRTWRQYAEVVLRHMAEERNIVMPQTDLTPVPMPEFFTEFPCLALRPLLSVCITTYNRAEWLALNLKRYYRAITLARSRHRDRGLRQRLDRRYARGRQSLRWANRFPLLPQPRECRHARQSPLDGPSRARTLRLDPWRR